jgi:hypothetical protein
MEGGKNQISMLIFDALLVGLRCRNPPRNLSQLKAREIPLIETLIFDFFNGGGCSMNIP